MPHYFVRWAAVQPGGAKQSDAWQGMASDDAEAKNAAKAQAQQRFPNTVNVIIEELRKR